MKYDFDVRYSCTSILVFTIDDEYVKEKKIKDFNS